MSRKPKKANADLTTVNARSIGIDVHKNKFVACFVNATTHSSETFDEERQQYEYLTVEGKASDRAQLVQWCLCHNADAIIMESTGVYWKAIFAEMEEAGLHPQLINPRHFHSNEEGRKTDTADARWLANLGRIGLYRASFIPEEPMRSLRLLVVAEHKITTALTADKNRVQKILDDAGIHLGSIFADPTEGKTARAILDLLLKGPLTSSAVDAVRDKRCQATTEDILAVCEGTLSDTSKYLLSLLIERVDLAKRQNAGLEALIMEKLNLNGMQADIDRLESIPGINEDIARSLIAIFGGNIGDYFSSVAAFCRWGGVCSGNHESAGVRKSSRCPHGLTTVKTLLVEAAQAAARTKGTEFYNFFNKKKFKGYNKAIMAVAHRLAEKIYLLLTKKQYYRSKVTDYAAVLAKKNQPRWIKKMTELIKKGVVNRTDLIPPEPTECPVIVREPAV